MFVRAAYVSAGLILLTNVSLVAQTGLYTLNGGSASQSNQTYAATATDQSSIYVTNSGDLTLTKPTITKTGNSSNVETSSQYGLNAAVLAASKGKVTITDGTISSSASGANGLFATGSGASITMTGGTIETTATGSHGVDATYGGSITLFNVDIKTADASASAGLSTDFGGGTVTATNGSVTTAGSRSPAIYSTGVITATNMKLTATGGEGGVIDGANSIIVNNCTISAKTYGFMVFRSTPDTGPAAITMNGGSLNVSGGDGFYIGSIAGSPTVNVLIKGGATVTASSGNLLRVDRASTVTLTTEGETLTGNVVAEAKSNITVKLTSSSKLTGKITDSALNLDSTSSWTATAASTLTTLTGAAISGTAVTNITANGITVTYDSSLSGNSYLGGKTYTLNGGGTLKPAGSTTSTATSTTLTVAASATSITSGGTVVLTATITPSTATGEVTFYDGATALGTATLASGKATFETKLTSAGGHPISAKYAGTSDYAASSATAITVNVTSSSQDTRTVSSGSTWTVSSTTTLSSLTLEYGGTIKAPDGYSLTMTVDGVETGQYLVTTAGAATAIAPGTYSGVVVLTVAKENLVSFSDGSSGGGGSGTPPSGEPPSGTPPSGEPPSGTPPSGTPPSGSPGGSGSGSSSSSTSGITFPIRQAVYIDDTGVVTDKSVAAAGSYTAGASSLTGLKVTSTGEAFNALYAAGGSYLIKNPVISLMGNGRSDFAGYGAAFTASGTSTKLVIDGAEVKNWGVVRTAVVATGGSNVVVKNSFLYTGNSILPADYTPSVNTQQMRSAPWMLGLNPASNVRATNLLGPSTKASYINSTIISDGWGVLSTDSGSSCTLNAINSYVGTVPDGDGYGSYAIGNATENFLGAQINVGTYAAINAGGIINYGNSAASAIEQLNTSLSLGLTDAERKALDERPTVINSKRFGVMWHSSSGTVNITGGTQFNTQEATFLVKTTTGVTINADGSAGATITPANGVLMQVMDNDDPGPVGTDALNTGVYEETTDTPAKASGFDVTSTTNAAAATFSNIALKGDFYNSVGWTINKSGSASSQNMALTFNNASITGVITSSEAHHLVSKIDSTLYYQLGVVKNTPKAAINNGVIVALNGTSKWTVTGASYLTKLTVGSGASIVSATGGSVTMTVDGVTTPITPGQTYTGQIKITN